MSETILIVDDEEPVRRTFLDWLRAGEPGARVLVAADAEAALRHANTTTIDLAVLDWNLGSGSDGLQLLQDLAVFCPDVVAILVTGFANQATPLDALRNGVRDYLDKNQDLNRETFLAAVRRQLDLIRPMKQQRAFNRGLADFRSAVEKVLPLVQTTAALSDPVPLPQAVGGLFRFLLRATGAADGVLLVRHLGDDETYRAHGVDGAPLEAELVPFARSLAASAVSMQEVCVVAGPAEARGVELQPFERGRSAILVAPVTVGPGLHAIVELFDKPGGFADADRHAARAAAELGGEVLRQALADRQARRMLFDAVEAALGATRAITDTSTAPEEPPPAAVMDTLRQGLERGTGSAADAAEVLELAEAVRELAVRHGPAAVRHCTRIAREVRALLDSVTGTEHG